MSSAKSLDGRRFIIAGERRSGTSTLAKWIEVHPEIYLYPHLDQAYFLDQKLRGRLEWLDGEIDPDDWLKDASAREYDRLMGYQDQENEKVSYGEKSADYFFWKPSLGRIKEFFPNIKIVLTFRNPVDRAWSHYWNEIGKGRETLSFEDAIAREAERMDKSDYAKVHLSYYSRGEYVKSLHRWFSELGKENVFIVILEDLIRNPEEELKALYAFLEVDTELGLERAGQRFNHNWTTIPTKFWQQNTILEKTEKKINRLIRRVVSLRYRDIYDQRRYGPKWEKITRTLQKEFVMDPDLRKKLIQSYEPFTSELEGIIGKNLQNWRK